MDKGAWKAAVHGVAKSPFIVAVSSRWDLFPWTSHRHAPSNTLCSEKLIHLHKMFNTANEYFKKEFQHKRKPLQAVS